MLLPRRLAPYGAFFLSFACVATGRAAADRCVTAAVAAIPATPAAEQASAPGGSAPGPDATAPAAAEPASSGSTSTSRSGATAAALRAARLRGAGRTNAAEAAPITSESDAATILGNGDVNLTGHVDVHQGEDELEADEVEYDANTSAFRVRGDVRYRSPLATVEGSGGTYSKQDGASFDAAQFELGTRPGHGTADTITLQPNGEIDLKRVTFTTCPAGAPDWQLRASDLDLDSKGKEGTAHGAEVDFKGVPVFYFPYLSFPLGDERRSGFLFPDFGHTSTNGYQVSVPYYWDLAPNYDFTFDPILYSRRGVDAAGEFRYLTDDSRGLFGFDFLPGDRLADDDPTELRPSDRAHLRFADRTDLPDGWRVTVKAETVSDPYYFEDFGQGTQTTSIAFLPQALDLSYRDPHWTLLGEFEHFQTIDTGLALSDRPYATLPRLVANGTWKLASSVPFVYGFDSELVDFVRSTGVTGWRFDGAPHVGIDWNGPGWFLRPSAGWRYTQYELDNLRAGADASPSRNLPTANLDAGLFFERLAGAQDQRLITLEPRMLYTYTPYRNQEALPLFDTTLPDLNLVELFRSNRYVGADRVADADQLALGVTSRLVDAASGNQFVAATLGQQYFFSPPRVGLLPALPSALPGGVSLPPPSAATGTVNNPNALAIATTASALPLESITGRNTSDLVGQVDVTAFRNWNLNLGVQWNPALGESERSEIVLQYRPAGDRVINFAYRFYRDFLQQAEISEAWPVTQHWNVYTRAVYDLLNHDFSERFAGFEYAGCCFKLRTVLRRYLSTRTGQSDTAVLLQVELNGLASVGTPATAFLQQEIRGYSAPHSVP